MRSVIAATFAVVAGLLAANMLGVASAEAPTTTTTTTSATTAPVPPRTVSVQGVASVPIGQSANASTATAVYREGMAAAEADGQNKAEFMTGKAGAALGSVQSITEGGGYIQCTANEESVNAEYQGEQPDFGSPPSVLPVGVREGAATATPPPGTPKPAVKHRKKRRAPSAKRAAVTTCRLTADVSLTYAIA